MKIGPELFSSYPAWGSFTVTIPAIIVARDSYSGDWDFGITLNSALACSKYEYGYTFKVAILGVGFEIWISKNLN